MGGRSECPICGEELKGGRCPRCGHLTDDEIFGDSRDHTVADQTDFKKKTFVRREKGLQSALVQLKEVALSSDIQDSASDTVSSALLLLNLPMEMETRSTINLDDSEKEVVRTAHEVVERLDMVKGGPVHPHEIYIRLGNAFYTLGDHALAKAYYDKAILRSPSNKIALYNRAVAMFALSEYDACVRSLEKLLNIDPDYEKALHLKELARQMDGRN